MRRLPLWFVPEPAKDRRLALWVVVCGHWRKTVLRGADDLRRRRRRSSRLRYYYWAGARQLLVGENFCRFFEVRCWPWHCVQPEGADARPVRLGGYILHQVPSNGGI